MYAKQSYKHIVFKCMKDTIENTAQVSIFSEYDIQIDARRL